MEKYWQSLDELNGVPDRPGDKIKKEHKNEVLELFEKDISGSRSSRRDFLKLLGFSFTTAAIAASCERPVQKAIPYVIHPEEIVPGQARYYASSFFDGKDFSHVVVKTRDGRPIKVEGNELSAFNKGGTTARVQASVLSLYDDARNKTPLRKGEETNWDTADQFIRQKMEELDKSGKTTVLLSSTVISPTTRRLINEFSGNFADFRWVEYDAISYSAILEANELSFGKGCIPDIHFGKADIVVSFGADFLGSWITPGHFIPSYINRRKLDEGQRSMLRHIQLEANLSLTGSNADERILMKPSEEKKFLANLYNLIAKHSGQQGVPAPEISQDLSSIAQEMFSAGEKAVVISGSNDTECQLLVNSINAMLGSIGTIVDLSHDIRIAKGDDRSMDQLILDMKAGKIGTILIHNVNPCYDYPLKDEFKTGLKQAGLSISFSGNQDETAVQVDYVCPVHHYLESWDDAEIIPGTLSLCQPCIHPILNTRSFQDSLLTWSDSESDYHQYLKDSWQENYFARTGSFEDFWNSTLQKGLHHYETETVRNFSFNADVLSGLAISGSTDDEGMELILYESIQMGNGKHANNPWLQELPDAITKVAWENVLLIAPEDASERNLKNGDVVMINDRISVPVYLQAGQLKGTCALALGYGRTESGKVADQTGVNAFPLVRILNRLRLYHQNSVVLEKKDINSPLALTQTHNSMEERPIVRETVLDKYLKDQDSGNEMHEEYESHHKTLYQELEFEGFHWGLAVDLNACVGCNACVIACQAENNIPVVGKDEVRRRRVMHWMKIDRYYSGDPANPKVSFQPLMCQHCDYAPCENVCPVSATNHSNEGINQMSYNRCIGTKYCINNCPYRVRRFNWYQYTGNQEFDYHINSDLGKMVLNPDVTVRERGVVEKCSFCVQRIQEKKLQAKLEKRTLEDGEIRPACVQACPAGALVFGDLKNPGSKVAQLFGDPRNYHLLEELHTMPSVGYLTKVRNTHDKV